MFTLGKSGLKGPLFFIILQAMTMCDLGDILD